MHKKFTSPYNSQENERLIYELWEKNNLFSPEVAKKTAETFTILMPPPNVTGILHLGHSLEHALMDARIRYERMKGKRALLVPGVDHAAIATQSRVEKDILQKENIKNPREHYGREALLKKIKEYADDARGNIIEQIKYSGVSCDWSRFRYTIDSEISKSVVATFKKMHDDGLIYQGLRIVNWDSRLQTTVSDDEIVREESQTPFYYLKYGPFTIGTSRPETKFGDKYVVMHPDDERYTKYKHLDTLKLEWINGPLVAIIIKDKAIDMEFGTGVMTITPWHDLVDFEIAERHNLEKEQIIDWNGKLMSSAGDFEGIHIKKARPLIIERLKEKGLVEKVDEKYINQLARSDRSGEIIEPQIKKQWFVSVTKKIPGTNKSLNDFQREVFEENSNFKINLFPEHFKKVYYEWVNNPRDWCISRQIWWGHRIPIWYKGEKVYCGETSPNQEEGWIQDEDTLDTWFSSGTWAYSTLGIDIEDKSDLEDFYPVNFMTMGYEIIFLWMARMVLMGIYITDKIPFKTVYIHGLVRDKTGKKFSKSLRNTIDIRDVVEKYGSDSLRFALLTGVTPGKDIRYDENKVGHSKKFINKLWNISRFILTAVDENKLYKTAELGEKEKKIVDEIQTINKQVGEHIEMARFNLAIDLIYNYTWHVLADKVIEDAKIALNGEDQKQKEVTTKALYEVFLLILKTLHPFAPFVTETIWQTLDDKKGEEYLITAKW